MADEEIVERIICIRTVETPAGRADTGGGDDLVRRPTAGKSVRSEVGSKRSRRSSGGGAPALGIVRVSRRWTPPVGKPSSQHLGRWLRVMGQALQQVLEVGEGIHLVTVTT